MNGPILLLSNMDDPYCGKLVLTRYRSIYLGSYTERSGKVCKLNFKVIVYNIFNIYDIRSHLTTENDMQDCLFLLFPVRRCLTLVHIDKML